MKLTENFTLEELIHSDYAVRHGFKNEPSPQIIQNLTKLAQTLEQIRAIIGCPININSGYRGLELNRAMKGASNSGHLLGFAADFTARRFGSPDKIVREIIKSGIKYDQLIEEGTWVHLSVDPKMRQQTLKATFGRRVTYSEFK
jgi:zinc D-Ala-D-Ala carboxypeptidase